MARNLIPFVYSGHSDDMRRTLACFTVPARLDAPCRPSLRGELSLFHGRKSENEKVHLARRRPENDCSVFRNGSKAKK